MAAAEGIQKKLKVNRGVRGSSGVPDRVPRGVPGTVYLSIGKFLLILISSSMAKIARVIASGYPHHITQADQFS